MFNISINRTFFIIFLQYNKNNNFIIFSQIIRIREEDELKI